MQLTRFDMKNLLNAITDLQRMQHMLLGTTDVIRNIRSGLRMRNFMGMFKRAAATAQRRWVLSGCITVSLSRQVGGWRLSSGLVSTVSGGL